MRPVCALLLAHVVFLCGLALALFTFGGGSKDGEATLRRILLLTADPKQAALQYSSSRWAPAAAGKQHRHKAIGQPPRRRAPPPPPLPPLPPATPAALKVLRTAIFAHNVFGEQDPGYNFRAASVCPLLTGQRVALVGNGPLTEQQRQEANAADVTMRFNALNNWEPGDKTDIWVIRYQPDKTATVGFSVPSLKWAQLQGCLPRVRKVARRVEQFWLVMMVEWDDLARERLGRLSRYLGIKAGAEDPRLLRMWSKPTADYIQWVMQQYQGIDRMVLPTTGMMGLLAALQCNLTSLDIYGSNWSDPWEFHQMRLEQQLIEELQRRGMVTVHPTPCLEKRHCGSAPQEATGVCDLTLLPKQGAAM